LNFVHLFNAFQLLQYQSPHPRRSKFNLGYLASHTETAPFKGSRFPRGMRKSRQFKN